MKEKRGAFTQQTLIRLILLVLTAAIIFLLITRIPHEEIINKETCYQSVLARSSFFLKELPENLKPPLQCKSEKVCLSMGENCPEGYKVVGVENEDEIKEEIAKRMYDCWSMLGRGELPVFGIAYTEKTRCVLCSVVTFDDGVQKKIGKINNFEGYLRDTFVPRHEFTYLEFLTNIEDAKYDITTDVSKDIFTKNDYAIVFSVFRGISFSRYMASIGAGAAVGAGAGVIIGSVVPGPGNVIGAGIGAIVGAIGGGYSGISSAGENLIATCEGDKGCASLFLIPYDAASLLGTCSTLESIP